MERDRNLPPTIDNPSGTCPWCGNVSNFHAFGEPDTLEQDPIWRCHSYGRYGGGTMHIPLARMQVLTCMGCERGTVVVEQRLIDRKMAMADANEGRIVGNVSAVVTDWKGASWWPIPGQARLDPSIPESVQKPYAEGLRALGAGAPNAAASTFRSAVVALVLDKGSEAAKQKRDLSDKLKQFIRDGGPTATLGDWAEHINLYGNAGAHPEAYGEVSVEEASEIAKLLRTLLELVYVLPATITARRGERMPGKP